MVMNGLVIVLIGIVALSAGYLLYGRWLAKKWGIDPKAKTPAYTHDDDVIIGLSQEISYKEAVSMI